MKICSVVPELLQADRPTDIHGKANDVLQKPPVAKPSAKQSASLTSQWPKEYTWFTESETFILRKPGEHEMSLRQG